jgi:hypothetical protein
MTGLSAAAQAVWRAHEQVLGEECVLTKTDMEALAAALRAVADQVVPHPGRYPMNEYMEGLRDCKQDFRAALLGIAAELEAHG